MNSAPVPAPKSQLARDAQGFNWPAFFWFTSAALVLSLSAIMSVGEGRLVYLPFFDFPMPESCLTRARFGIDCPGCGLTRSFIHTAHGRFHQAFDVNWVGLLLFPYAVFQLPLSLIHWCLPWRKRQQLPTYLKSVWWNERIAVGFAALLGIRWLGVALTGWLL